MSHAIWLAFGLLLIVEGIGPFLCPDRWRNTILQVTHQPNMLLRRFGGGLVIAGAIITYFYLY